MRKIFTSLLLMGTSFNLLALDLDEAVQLALKNSYTLEQQQHIYEQSKEDVTISRASFLPKADLAYTYNDKRKTVGTTAPSKDSTATATLSINLFNGFSDFNTLKSSKLLEASSKFTLKAKEQDIIYLTKQRYIGYLNAKKSVTTFEDAYKLFDKQYMDAKIRFEQGLLAKNDLLQVNINMLQAKQNLTRAKKDLEVARLNLFNLFGHETVENQAIDEIAKQDFSKLNFDKSVLENRSEIQALEKTMQSYKSLANAQKGEFLPTVTGSFTASKYGTDADLESDHEEKATISASWNLYNGGSNYAKTRQYMSQKRELRAKLEQTKLDINLQFKEALLELDVAKQNYETATVAYEQAQENYKIVNNRFQEGLSSTTDLIDANYLLTQAKQQYSQAYYDKYLSVALLNRVTETN